MNEPKFGAKAPSRPCIFCGGLHFDTYCTVGETAEQRLQIASERGITCLRCLARNHTTDACLSAFRGCVYCHSQEHNVSFCQKAIDNQTRRRMNACAFCEGPHMEIDCTQYKTASARTLQAQQRGRCLGCLSTNHSVLTCTLARNICVYCHHLALLTGRSDASPYHNITLCPVKFPDPASDSNGVGGHGTKAEAMPGSWCDGYGSSTNERMELDEQKKQLEDEKNQLSAERERLGAVDFGVLKREVAVKRREEELAAENSRMAGERGRIEKAKTQLADLEKRLNDREKKLCEEEAQLSVQKSAFKQQQLQAVSSSTHAEDELQVDVVREENRRLHCELAQVIRERDAAIALSEERKGDLDKAHKTLNVQFRKRRELRDVYYQLEAQRDRYKAEKEALALTLQFRHEDFQQAHQGSAHPTSVGTVRIKQEVIDVPEAEASSAALGGGKRPSHPTNTASGTKRQRQQWDDAAVDALKQRLADLANECGGEPDTWQTVVKFNAFIEGNIRRVGDSTALIDFLKRAEPANSSIADRIEQLVNRN